MLSGAANRGLFPVSPILTTQVGEFMRSLAELFRVTAPMERDLLAHRVMLLTILAVGTWVRFWGLDNVGLHGDEETMAMATMSIVREGAPYLPSGMFYPRGMTQLYLMAGSVQLFGESEWAFRFPSAVCGVLVIWLSWLAGRRFLRPYWNLAFAAAVALLPAMIVYSQTARMYIFLLAAVAACMVCVFAWERSGRVAWLIGAVVALVIGIDLQALAVTVILLFLMPGILQGDLRKLLLGSVAAAVVMVSYMLINGWVDSHYPVPPPEYAADLGPPMWDRSRASQGFARTFEVALWIAGLAIAFFAIHLSRVVPQRIAAISVASLLLLGLLAQLKLHYHIAGILFIAAMVVARRFGGPRVWRRLRIFALGSGLLALIHFSLLAATPGSLKKVIGALVGQPSIWPYFRVVAFSEVAGLLALAALAWGLWRLMKRRRVTDYVLFGVLGVWVPMFTIGFFVWSMPPRYTVASLIPMLLCAFAFAQKGTDWLQAKLATRNVPMTWDRPLQMVAAIVVTILVVNPVEVVANVNSGYESHPDHKGAAEFMKAQHIVDADVIIAEDVLQQTYYLGRVDYWLMSRNHARRYVELVDGKIRDFYTGAGVVSSAKLLEDLLRQERGQRIFVIGSGENQSDKRKGMRGDMDAVLHSNQFEVVYEGRDGLTQVWRATGAPPPQE
ncbi:ArnT family glycosyltransferase [Steroidobacter sp.]|uniref:ArnT family glycosyltransferase n=1 Tax=Steroidobacter sp. TaxID=1978227 RepID=UPI001A42A5EA|nr:glycosyltransferase family 39 protein [Steroidobacter sp.]MBL8270360.1 glycosyltransferase family 39 protein [Steroidobacter sp.]